MDRQRPRPSAGAPDAVALPPARPAPATELSHESFRSAPDLNPAAARERSWVALAHDALLEPRSLRSIPESPAAGDKASKQARHAAAPPRRRLRIPRAAPVAAPRPKRRSAA